MSFFTRFRPSTPTFSPPPAYVPRRPEVFLELSKKNGVSPLPYELLSFIPEEVYSTRTRNLMLHLQKYSWSVFERIWIFVMFLCVGVAPWPLLAFIRHKLLANDIAIIEATPKDQVPDINIDDLQKVRLINLGVILGLILVFIVPYLVFKRLGTIRLQKLLHEINREEGVKGVLHATHWRITSTSTFSGRSTLVINLPQAFTAQPSVFHPQANLPPYIAQPYQHMDSKEKAETVTNGPTPRTFAEPV